MPPRAAGARRERVLLSAKRPNQKDYTIRLQQYFDHYLKGAHAPAWMEKGVPYIERERTELSAMGDKK